MSILHDLKLKLTPPRITDPDLGSMVFLSDLIAPERSYWECEWTFPKTGTAITISLPGDENGPAPETREFYLSLPERFEAILAAARPKLEKIFEEWLKQDLPQDIFSALKLTGFEIEDAKTLPLRWDISFETTGELWLGIIIPFIGDTAQAAVVDT